MGGIFCFIQLPSIYFFFLNLYVNWAILLIFLLYSIYQISFSALLYWVVYLWAQSPVQCTYMTLELYTFMPYHQEMFTFMSCHQEMFTSCPTTRRCLPSRPATGRCLSSCPATRSCLSSCPTTRRYLPSCPTPRRCLPSCHNTRIYLPSCPATRCLPSCPATLRWPWGAWAPLKSGGSEMLSSWSYPRPSNLSQKPRNYVVVYT